MELNEVRQKYEQASQKMADSPALVQRTATMLEPYMDTILQLAGRMSSTADIYLSAFTIGMLLGMDLPKTTGQIGGKFSTGEEQSIVKSVEELYRDMR